MKANLCLLVPGSLRSRLASSCPLPSPLAAPALSAANCWMPEKLQLHSAQSWALPVFFKFFNDKKWFFAFFNKLILLGVGFLNSLGAEMQKWVINLIKNAKKSVFIIEKVKKYRKCPPLARPSRHSLCVETIKLYRAYRLFAKQTVRSQPMINWRIFICCIPGTNGLAYESKFYTFRNFIHSDCLKRIWRRNVHAQLTH